MKQRTPLFSIFRSTSLTLGVTLCFSVYLSSCTAQIGRDLPQHQVILEQTQSARLVEHAMGETLVSERPENVVVLTNEATDMLLALGITPVGAVQSWQGEPYYDYLGNQLDNVPVVGDELRPNLDSIAALKPDLIIGSKVRHRGVYKQLNAIAPTIFSETIGATWKDNFSLYAEAVNREAEARSLLQQWDERITKFKQGLGSNPPTVSLVRFLPGATRVYFNESFPGQVVKEAGLARPGGQDAQSFGQRINLDKIESLEADYLFYFTFDDEKKSGSKTENEWLGHPLWQELEVVQQDKAHAVGDAEWTSSSGILAANLILDDLSNYILSQTSAD